MERTVYAAIKRTDQQQVAAEKARVVETVPLLAVLAPVGVAGSPAGGLSLLAFAVHTHPYSMTRLLHA
jgi:D-serine dehydratase